MRKTLASIVCLAMAVTVFVAAPLSANGIEPVDLTTWTAESYPAVSGFYPGIWTVVPPENTTVNQSVNGQPTLFYSDFTAFNTDVKGEIKVETIDDDDFIGFALGFEPGDATNASADYLLVDWKQGTQYFNFGAPSCTPGSTAPAGLAVSRVFGIPTADEFWGHTNFDSTCSDLDNGLQELARAATLGSTGWSDLQEYTFEFEFNATSLKVYVDGALEISITGSFADGRLAFYNFSQEDVTYSGFTAQLEAEISIDIKPGSFPNSINLGSNGVVPVAILTTDDFDATTVDPSTVQLAGADVRVKGKSGNCGCLEDIDGDGDLDLVVQVYTEALDLSAGDVEAVLTALTFDGEPVTGSDSIRIVPVE
jgi:hypothetical protein